MMKRQQMYMPYAGPNTQTMLDEMTVLRPGRPFQRWFRT